MPKHPTPRAASAACSSRTRDREVILILDDDEEVEEEEVVVGRRNLPGEGGPYVGGRAGDGARGKVVPSAAATARARAAPPPGARAAPPAAAQSGQVSGRKDPRKVCSRNPHGGGDSGVADLVARAGRAAAPEVAAGKAGGRRRDCDVREWRCKIAASGEGGACRRGDGKGAKIASCTAQGKMPRLAAGVVGGRDGNGRNWSWEAVEVTALLDEDKSSVQGGRRRKLAPVGEACARHDNVGACARHSSQERRRCNVAGKLKGLSEEASSHSVKQEKDAEELRRTDSPAIKQPPVEISDTEEEEETELRTGEANSHKRSVGGTGKKRKYASCNAALVNRAGNFVASRTRARVNQRRPECTTYIQEESPHGKEEEDGNEEEEDGDGGDEADQEEQVHDKDEKDGDREEGKAAAEEAVEAALCHPPCNLVIKTSKHGRQEEEEEEEDEDYAPRNGDSSDGESSDGEEVEEAEEYEEDGDEDHAGGGGGGRGGEEAEGKEGEESCHTPSNVVIETGALETFRKRSFSGISVLLPVGSPMASATGSPSTDTIGIAQRTRSHFSSGPAKKKLLKVGTFSKPLCIDVTGSGSEPEPEQEPDLLLPSEQREPNYGGADGTAKCSNKKEGRGQGNGSNARGSENGGSKVPSSEKRKRRHSPEAQALIDCLINTICDEEEISADDFVLPPPDEPLPLLFSFGDEEDNDRAGRVDFLDELWTDFDFAKESANIGIHPDNDEGQGCSEQDHCTDPAQCTEQDACTSPRALCPEGKHHLVLDEQIGIRCEYCSFVDTEIRYILQSLIKGGFSRTGDAQKGAETDGLFDDLLALADELKGAEGFSGCKTGTVWDLVPRQRDTMYPHQQEAFEFMWRNLAGGIALDELNSTARSEAVGGCVISHDPGTGKTRLAIAFMEAYLKVFPRCRPVVIAPKGILPTWGEQFRRWNPKLPFQVLDSDESPLIEDGAIRELAAGEPLTKKGRRNLKLISWHRGDGILGLSYTRFRKMAAGHGGEEVRKLILERPGLIVLDEGHIPRNEDSQIWKLLVQVKTEKRIILSGTPFQNNFDELYNILCLVRPKFADKIAPRTARQRRALPASESQHEKDDGKVSWTSLTTCVTDGNVEKVRAILKPFVHVHNGDVLQSLPGLRESVVILNPLPYQKEIIAKMEKAARAFDAEHKISLASVHPALITRTELSDEEAASVDRCVLESLWSKPYEGVKTKFVIEFVRLCEALREKVLVFSQFLDPLSMLKKQLMDHFGWTEGKEVLQMDGTVLVRHRQSMIEAFNDAQSETRVMLASTKACSEGIHLTGASRVVLLDVVWNPAVQKQAIGRAYRIGQEKVVYTYNLIAEGTKEEKKYDRQVRKDHLSKLLFSSENARGGLLNRDESSESVSDDKVLEEMTGHDQLRDMFVKIYRSQR